MTRIRSMEEFAAASGVSRPTLSRYFSDPSTVRITTRQRIEAALSKHEYHPNFFAINQNRKRPKNIGILVPHLTDPFYAELVRQTEARCSSMGFWTIVLSAHGDPAQEERALRTLLSLNLAGAIISPLGSGARRRLFEAVVRNLPAVFLDSRVEPQASFVGTNNDTTLRLMVDYLVRTGEAPCYLDMPAVNQNAGERRRAYEDAAVQAGFEPRVIPVAGKNWNFEQAGFETIAMVVSAHCLPSRTLLCANDRLAFGALAAARSAGLKVGRHPAADLRVAGHDDHPLSRFACPSLTTISRDCAQLANAAFDALRRRLAGESPADCLLGGQLMMRDSA